MTNVGVQQTALLLLRHLLPLIIVVRRRCPLTPCRAGAPGAPRAPRAPTPVAPTPVPAAAAPYARAATLEPGASNRSH